MLVSFVWVVGRSHALAVIMLRVKDVLHALHLRMQQCSP